MTTTENTSTDNFLEPGDGASAWVAQRLSGLMAANDVPARQQAGLLSELCGLSLSQARRKLHGAVWSFGEVQAVVQRFGASLDEVFPSVAGDDGQQISLATEAYAVDQQDANFLMGAWSLPCRVRIGARVGASLGERELLTAVGDSGWVVGTAQQFAGRALKPPFFLAKQVLLLPTSSQPSIRVAILDDDAGTAESLAEWFNASGYVAQAYTSGEQLLASGIDDYAAFIVDFMLAGGESSQAIIRALRDAQPSAPILLLTGKLRSGQASEAELVALLRTLNVAFFEKPVRPSVLAATIESELDQLARGHCEP